VAEHSQVFDSLYKSLNIVDRNCSKISSYRWLVQEHDRDIGRTQQLDRCCTDFRSEDGQSINAAFKETANSGNQPLFVVSSIGNRNVYAMLSRQQFKMLDQIWKERVSDIGHYDSEKVAAP